MGFERTIGPGKVHASTRVDATVLSPGVDPKTPKTPKLGSMLPTGPVPPVPPSAWKRPILVNERSAAAPARKPTSAPAIKPEVVERSLPSTRPPPALSIPPASTKMSPWLAAAIGAGSVLAIVALAFLLAPSSLTGNTSAASAAPPPSVAAWTLEDAPGVSVSPVPALPSVTAPTTSAAPSAVPSASAAKPNPAPSSPIQNTR